jgi:TonB family protein
MLLLPTFNAALMPCPVGPAEFTAHAKGHFCGHCQRVVQDFSQSQHPVADLAAARAASVDGRVCGRFGAAQVAARLPFTRRLKWFLLALVLVVGQGLTAHEALAQVRRPVPHKATAPHRKPAPVPKPERVPEEVFIQGVAEVPPEECFIQTDGPKVYSYVAQMPTFRGGDVNALIAYLRQQVQRPAIAAVPVTAGRVFVNFTVGADGVVRDARIIKGLHPALDAEALRVTRVLTGFAPGRQNGQAVAVSLTVPVTFEAK